MCSLLALKSGRPVKWRWTREEEFLCSSTRAPWHMEIADAVSKDGWILGRKMLTLHDSGAYARFSPYGLTKHSFHHTGAYTIPNLHFDGYVVFTNRVPTTAMRGFGVTSISFAIETHMSRIADVLGVDPFEIRLKNANRIGDTSPNGVVYTDPSTVPTIQAIADAARPRAVGRVPDDDPEPPRGRPAPRAPRRPGREPGGALMAVHTGRGISAIEYPTGMNQNGDPSQAWIKIKPDGRVDVFSGTSDIGNGSKTIQSQIVAETLGVPYDWITYDNSNTDSSPVCTGTFASRATFVAGMAVKKAAENAREQDARDRRQGAGDRPGRPRGRRRRGGRQGRAAEEDLRRRRRRRGDVDVRRADHGHRRAAEALRGHRRRRDRAGRPAAPLGDLLRRLRGRGRGRRRDGRRARDAALCSASTSAGRSTRRSSRARSRAARCRASGSACSRTATRTTRRSSTGAGSSARTSRRAWRTCRRSTRSSSRTRPPTAPTARRASARWRTTRSRPRSRRPSTTPSASGSPSCRSRRRRCCARSRRRGRPEPRREGKKVIFDEELSVNTVGNGSVKFEVPA